MLNYEFPPLGGGGSPVSYEIAKGYVGLGHSVTVVTMAYKDLPGYEIKDGIEIYRVPCWRSKKEICHPWEQLTYILSAKGFLKQHLKNHKYDINHTHFIIPTGIISLWLKKRYNLPYIITSHGSDVPGYNPDRFQLLHKFTGPILRRICENAKIITTPSRYLKDLIEKNIGHYKIAVIPNSSRDFFVENIKKENIIISSGRLLPRKGFHLLIEAFNQINHPDWKLYICGDGPYRKKLEEMARNNRNIIFTGWLNNTEKEYRLLMNKAKIFALLSSFETQGIVFVEAMSAGCAILSSNATACKETVSKDIGYLVNLENKKEIEEKIKEMINRERLLNKFAENSRKRYEKDYTYNNVINQYAKNLNGIS